MPDASFVQSAFLGGEWGPNAQGRYDLPKYRQAMATCFNGLPTVEGAWTRRPGTAFLATTYGGTAGRVLSFDFTDSSPYTIEVTNNVMRMFAGTGLVCTNDVTGIADVSPDTPAVVTLAGPVTWSTGDQIQLQVGAGVLPTCLAPLRNRQVTITMLNTVQFTIADSITGAAIAGATLGWAAGSNVSAEHILIFSTPWAINAWANLRVIQAASYGPNNSNVGVLLPSGVSQPYLLTATANPTASEFAEFTLSPAFFVDGPYMDILSGALLTPSGTSGEINCTISYQTWSSSTAYAINAAVEYSGQTYVSLSDGNYDNTPSASPAAWQLSNAGVAVGVNGFQTTDVGRLIRIFSQPLTWVSSTAYTAGNVVLYNGGYYSCLTNNTGQQPDTATTYWGPVAGASYAAWSWGVITSVVSAAEVNVTLSGGPLLYANITDTWQIGAYSNTTGWPTCGLFYEGRLWLAGAQPNRLDGSTSDDIFTFSPTGPDGTVADNNGVTEVFNSSDLNTIYWLAPIGTGQFVCGTKNGEWLVQASTLNDPITPSSIQSHRVTKYGCANILPCQTPLTTVLVQKYQRELLELFPDVFSGRLVAPSVNQFARHMTAPNAEEIAYQQELAPVIWVRLGNGGLAGCTYRRTSCLSNSEPDFVGWHLHKLGSGRVIASMTIGPSPSETLDTLTLATAAVGTNLYHVEQLTPLFDTTGASTAAWFVDDAVTPSGIVTSPTGITCYGYQYLAGSTISMWIGGLDCGDYVVSTTGSVFVPYGSDPNGLLTLAYLQGIQGNGYGAFATPLVSVSSVTPPPLPSNGTVQQLFPPNQTSHYNNGGMLIDWANQRAFIYGQSGVQSLSMTTGQGLAQAAVNGSTSPTVVLGADSNIYAWVGTSQTFQKMNPTTLAVEATAGSSMTSANMDGAVSTQGADGDTYVAWGDLAGLNDTIKVFDGTKMTYANATCQASGTGYGGINRPAVAAGPGCFYVVDSPSGTVSSLGLYAMVLGSAANTTLGTNPNPNIVVQQRGSLNASQVDPSWTYFGGLQGGIVYDSTDGNLIIGVTGGPASPGNYIIKVRPSTMELVWSTPLTVNDFVCGQNQIEGGLLTWTYGTFSSTKLGIAQLNTLTGAVNTFSIPGITAPGYQGSSDVSGVLVSVVTYAQATGTPTPTAGTESDFNAYPAIIQYGGVFFGSITASTSGFIPAVGGFTYNSEGQLLRSVVPQDAGSATGPSIGKTQRLHMASALFAATQGVSWGTVDGGLFPVPFNNANGSAYALNQLYTGVAWDTFQSNYSFNEQPYWQITRPYPATIAAFGGFINTQDR